MDRRRIAVALMALASVLAIGYLVATNGGHHGQTALVPARGASESDHPASKLLPVTSETQGSTTVFEVRRAQSAVLAVVETTTTVEPATTTSSNAPAPTRPPCTAPVALLCAVLP